MSVKYYYDLMSQPCRALMLFLLKNKIPYEDKKVNLAKGEHFSDNFVNVNPFRKVPVVEHGDFTLTESVAIFRYLCREFDVPDHWYPKDSKGQAKVDEYMEWQHLNTRAQCALYFLNKFIYPIMSGKPARLEVIDKHEKKMIEVLDQLETIWLAKSPYLTGNKISIADLLGVCEVEQPKMAGFDPCKGRPNITAWMARVRQDMQPHYDIVHDRVYKITEKYKGVPPVSVAKL